MEVLAPMISRAQKRHHLKLFTPLATPYLMNVYKIEIVYASWRMTWLRQIDYGT